MGEIEEDVCGGCGYDRELCACHWCSLCKKRVDQCACPYRRTLRDVTREHITTVLNAVQGNRTKAAQILGISRRTIYRWIADNNYRFTLATT
jgi:DNA-binding NtrC family response regulator